MAPAWARTWLVSGENSRFSDGTVAKATQNGFVEISLHRLLQTVSLQAESRHLQAQFQGFDSRNR